MAELGLCTGEHNTVIPYRKGLDLDPTESLIDFASSVHATPELQLHLCMARLSFFFSFSLFLSQV